ncbi:MAG: hypothetical protein HYY65_04745 [Candidatus Tectomicrobia bacterium]|uniref:DUF4148 domain-containing protein n=1 Tax=Tectimicrobiota bacterium TaxID=2528274 RepID=A0A932M089_UNCTE|nr:hypothetical protein [Candidatus Tectomicrobia bacterium]
MKRGTILMGLAAVSILFLGVTVAHAQDNPDRAPGSIAQARLDREINSPAVPAYTGQESTAWNRENQAPGSIAQARLDREIRSPEVAFTGSAPVAESMDPDRAPGSIAQARLDREINSPVPVLPEQESVPRAVVRKP